jgi:hypothetical protein
MTGVFEVKKEIPIETLQGLEQGRKIVPRVLLACGALS